MSDYKGSARSFGGRVVTTERRLDGSWSAFVDGNRAKWEAGATEVEALGKCVVTHGAALDGAGEGGERP